MVDCLIFSVCYFWFRKKWCLQNFCLINKWMMLEIVDKSAFEAMTMPDNLILICRFRGCNLVFCSLYMIHKICFLLKYDLWKLQQESWNTNPKSLNRTLGTKGTRGEENEEWAQWAKKKEEIYKINSKPKIQT